MDSVGDGDVDCLVTCKVNNVNAMLMLYTS